MKMMRWMSSFGGVLCAIVLMMQSCSCTAGKKEREEVTDRLKVGVVFGGGGAKGAAQVGVLRYIEKAGLPVDYVVGTSIGSIVAGLYASGCTVDQMDSLFRSQHWAALLTDRRTESHGLVNDILDVDDGGIYVFGYPILKPDHDARDRGDSKTELSNLGVLRGDSIATLLEQLSGQRDEIQFDDLRIPFRCVAVDAGKMEEVVFDHGHLPSCMRASMAIPMAFQPVKIEGRTFIDGGMINNLPVDVCRAMGADIVIAIDLTQEHLSKEEEAALKADTTQAWYNDVLDFFGAETANRYADWAFRGADKKRYLANRDSADLVINPNLGGYGTLSFSHKAICDMMDMGEKTGRSYLPQLQQLRVKVMAGKK